MSDPLAAAQALETAIASDDVAAMIQEISACISSTYVDGIDPETHMRRRVGKIHEEGGEVEEAIGGLVGENPRKGQTHTLDDLRHEVLDVAVAALGAWSHLCDDELDPIDALHSHVSAVAERLHGTMIAIQPAPTQERP